MWPTRSSDSNPIEYVWYNMYAHGRHAWGSIEQAYPLKLVESMPRHCLAMEAAVISQHASPNTVFHCLYGFYCLGYSRKELARIYHKSIKTIGNWINVYERTGTYQRAERESSHVFTKSHRTWQCQFYTERPLAYLDEAQEAFSSTHHISISKPSVWRILHDCRYTRQVLERGEMHIKEKDVFRFLEELSQIDWCHQNIIFLDEVSFAVCPAAVLTMLPPSRVAFVAA
ncbi:Hypothetical protein PHPALM_18488 [Phytophthora palmivora]|uniref:Uncharacterized protein n=1 Tax=Phytophthora palmivora TaxID=4796 RepID=A0A2P4XJL3_9STRA|nr:Hypothetical protein PHPALM_18488 [Phytophthora palmivora]